MSLKDVGFDLNCLLVCGNLIVGAVEAAICRAQAQIRPGRSRPDGYLLLVGIDSGFPLIEPAQSLTKKVVCVRIIGPELRFLFERVGRFLPAFQFELAVTIEKPWRALVGISLYDSVEVREAGGEGVQP